jgi:hypothetical protein
MKNISVENVIASFKDICSIFSLVFLGTTVVREKHVWCCHASCCDFVCVHAMLKRIVSYYTLYSLVFIGLIVKTGIVSNLQCD